MKTHTCLLLSLIALALPAAAAAQDATATAATTAAVVADSVVVGPTDRDKVEHTVADWVAAEAEAKLDGAAVAGLARVPKGAEVTVYLGTWCSDSKRELSRLFRVCDELSGLGEMPFSLRYVGVDRQKAQPAEAIAADGVLYLPTFIVRRDGHEVGRIVETSPHSVEEDLLALLSGKAAGVLSASRPELAAAAKP